MTTGEIRVWCLLGRKAGDNTQVRALADELGFGYEEKRILARPWELLVHLWPRANLAGIDRHAIGLPTDEEYIARYCERTGRDGIDNWNFYIAFSLFRLAAIAQGIVKRAQIGTASSAEADSRGAIVVPLADMAVELIN